MLNLRTRLGLPALVPRAHLLCSRCNNRVVGDVGFFRKREVCAPCLIIEAAVATVAAKNWAIISAAVAIIGIIITIVLAPPAANSIHSPPPIEPRPPQPQPVNRAGPPALSSAPVARTAMGNRAALLEAEAVPPTAPARAVVQASTEDSHAVERPPIQTAPTLAPETVRVDTSSAAIVPPVVEREQETLTLIVQEEITVAAPAVPAQRIHEAALPSVPNAVRAGMSGRCVALLVTIAPDGKATARVEDTGRIAPLFVDACVRDATRRWLPARNAAGESVADARVMRYCWK